MPIMRLGGIDFFIDQANNIAAQFPPTITAYCSNIKKCIGPEDTVIISGGQSDDSIIPPIIGRVIDVVQYQSSLESHRDNRGIPLHPLLNRQSTTLCLIKFIITKEDAIAINEHQSWPSINADALLACRDLPEVATTNMLVWTDINQISHLSPIIHTLDCVDQTYGHLAGRDNTYHTSCNTIFDDNGDYCIEPVARENYDAFGPDTHSSNPRHVSETERLVEVQMLLGSMGKKCLTTSGKIGGTNRISQFLSKACWSTIHQHISSMLDVQDDNRERNASLLLGNLGLQTRRLPNCRSSLTAREDEQFTALYSFLGGNFGVGVCKRPPTTQDIANGRGTFSLQIGDVVHMVGASLEGQEDTATQDWFPEYVDPHQRNYFGQGRNYTKLTFDLRTRMLTLSFKAIAVKVGRCAAESVINHLDRYGIEWVQNEQQHHPELRHNRSIIYNNNLYRIGVVNYYTDTVELVPVIDQHLSNVTLSITAALDILM